MSTPQEEFLTLLIAAMQDAANDKKLTQVKTTIAHKDGRLRFIRLIVIPEELEYIRKEGEGYVKT